MNLTKRKVLRTFLQLIVIYGINHTSGVTVNDIVLKVIATSASVTLYFMKNESVF